MDSKVKTPLPRDSKGRFLKPTPEEVGLSSARLTEMGVTDGDNYPSLFGFNPEPDRLPISLIAKIAIGAAIILGVMVLPALALDSKMPEPEGPTMEEDFDLACRIRMAGALITDRIAQKLNKSPTLKDVGAIHIRVVEDLQAGNKEIEGNLTILPITLTCQLLWEDLRMLANQRSQ